MGNACTTKDKTKPVAEDGKSKDMEKRIYELERQATLAEIEKKEALQQLHHSKSQVTLLRSKAFGANFDEADGIYKSQYEDVKLEEISLTDFVFKDFGKFRDEVAVVDGDSAKDYKYKDLEKLVKKVGASLYQKQFLKGDVCAVFSPNMREYPILFHAVAKIGGIITTCSPQYTAGELATQLQDTKAKILVTTKELVDIALEAKASSPTLEEIYTFGAGRPQDGEFTRFKTLTEGKPDECPEPRISPKDDVVVIPYSSGTSGPFKGVMLTHYNIVSNLLQVDSMLDMTHKDVVLGMLPMHHMYGMFIFLCLTLRKGATLVTMKKFTPDDLLKITQDQKISIIHLVPPIVNLLSKSELVENYNLSSVREIIVGAAPLSGALAADVSARLGCSVRQGYGMTELSPVVAIMAQGSKKYSAVGRMVPNTCAKVINPQTRELCNPGEEGEIWIAGPQVMKGYLNNPESTQAAIDVDGYYHSGDIGLIDKDGDMWITDRLKELIKYKGHQVAPAELEKILMEHPGVKSAAVVGIADDDVGEIPCAYVEKEHERVSAKELMEFVAERVAGYKKIRQVHFVKSIPHSQSGKILRRVLRDNPPQDVKEEDERKDVVDSGAPVRYHMDDPETNWRDGKPDFSEIDKCYLETRKYEHKEGSLENRLHNSIATFQMELLHKPDLKDWGSVDPEKFTVSFNNGNAMDIHELMSLAKDKRILSGVVDVTREEDITTAFENGMFAFEIVDSFTEVPHVAFNWRHWGTVTGPYKDGGKTNQLIEQFGLARLELNDKDVIESLQVYYKPVDFYTELATGKKAHSDQNDES